MVWERYADPRRWDSWAPHIRGVDYPHDRLRADTTGEVRGPLGLRVPFTVDAVDEQRRTWAWTVHVRARGRNVTTVSLEHGVEGSGEPGRVSDDRKAGCTTWLRLHGAWPVIVGYTPVAWYALGRLVRR